MANLQASLQRLNREHRDALEWFLHRTGECISWPEPMANGLYLVNKAKGIHKPGGWTHALSVRQNMGGPYSDREIVERQDGSWQFDYFQEGRDPAQRDSQFTNRALMENIRDNVPVAVLKQTSGKPAPRYDVLGLAAVVGWNNGYFRLEGYPPPR